LDLKTPMKAYDIQSVSAEVLSYMCSVVNNKTGRRCVFENDTQLLPFYHDGFTLLV